MNDQRKLRRMNLISYIRVVEATTNENIGRIVDISTEGMRLRSEALAKVGSILELSMDFPINDEDTKQIRFDAMIIWSRPIEGTDFFDSGVQLLNVPNDYIEMIENYMLETSVHNRWLNITECFTMDHQ